MNNFFNTNIRLLRKRKNRTQSALAAEFQLKRTTINALENEISQPSVIQLQLYSRYFGIAIDTLINVDLRQLSERQFMELQNGSDIYLKGTKLRVIATTVDSDNNDNIELVNEKAKAGYTNCFADPEFIESLPVFQLPFLSPQKKYRAFTISGESMLPVQEGSVVIGEYVEDFLSLRDDDAYVIVTRDEGVVFKLIRKDTIHHGNYRMISMNPEYESYTMSISQFAEVWKFVCYFQQDLPEPMSDLQQILNKVSQLDDRVSEIQDSL